MRTSQDDIGAKVAAQYEAFPYPNYNLLLPLRSQEAYASHSLFAARVLEQQGRPAAIRGAARPAILLAGCGDTLPYLLTFWEPRRHRLTAVDLSAANLRRARLRCRSGLRLRPIAWRQSNVEDTESDLPDGLSHIESYGVLHHLANPARVLERFGRSLLPGGTARIMVYNNEARSWIRHVQKAFTLLGLSAFRSRDRQAGKSLLERLGTVAPALRVRFAAMPGTFTNASRFVDTFLHAREARLGLEYWLDAIQMAGLRVTGVYDRYGELDDLPNPLLEAPPLEAWLDRIEDRRFENNFELYLAKTGSPASAGIAGSAPAPKLPSRQFLKSPPEAWFSYPETRGLSWINRHKIWSHFLGALCRRDGASAEAWAGGLAPEALQRLGRIGAFFPEDFRSAELRDLLRRPLYDFMEPPDFPGPAPVLGDRALRSEVEGILREGNRPLKYLDAVMKRLDAAQTP